MHRNTAHCSKAQETTLVIRLWKTSSSKERYRWNAILKKEQILFGKFINWYFFCRFYWMWTHSSSSSISASSIVIWSWKSKSAETLFGFPNALPKSTNPRLKITFQFFNFLPFIQAYCANGNWRIGSRGFFFSMYEFSFKFFEVVDM